MYVRVYACIVHVWQVEPVARRYQRMEFDGLQARCDGATLLLVLPIDDHGLVVQKVPAASNTRLHARPVERARLVELVRRAERCQLALQRVHVSKAC